MNNNLHNAGDDAYNLLISSNLTSQELAQAMGFTENLQYAPKTVRELESWITSALGVSPLPYKLGERYPNITNQDGSKGYKRFADMSPTEKDIEGWLSDPSVSLGAYCGKALGRKKVYVYSPDFDHRDGTKHTDSYAKDASEVLEIVRSLIAKFPELALCPCYRSPSGGIRFIVLVKQQFAGQAFDIPGYEGESLGEMICSNPTNFPHPDPQYHNGREWLNFPENVPIFESMADVGFTPRRSKKAEKTAQNSPKVQGPAPGPSPKTVPAPLLKELLCKKARDIIDGRTECVGDRGEHVAPLINELLGWKRYFSLGRGYCVESEDVYQELYAEAWTHVPEKPERDGSSGGFEGRRDHLWKEVEEKRFDELAPAIAGSEENWKAVDEHIRKITHREIGGGMSEDVEARADLSKSIGDAMDRRDKHLNPHDYLDPDIAQEMIDAAKAMNSVPAFIFAPFLASAASCVGSAAKLSIIPGSDYIECTNIRTCVVAETGRMKTPSIRIATKPLAEMEKAANNDYEKSLTEWKQQEKDSKNKKDSPTEKEPKPTRVMHICTDSTTEGLARVLKENPRGVLGLHDELEGYFNGFDKYRMGGGDDAQKDLEEFNGNSISIVRANGDTSYFIPEVGVSRTGGAQFQALRNVLHKLAGKGGDYAGLLARWLFVAESLPKPVINLRANSKPTQLPRMLTVLYTRLKRVEKAQYTLSDEAGTIYETICNHLIDIGEFSENQRITSTIPKLRTYVGRLMLVIHLISEAWRTPDIANIPKEISAENAEKAAKLAMYFLDQLRIILDINGDGEEELTGLTLDIHELSLKRQSAGKDGWITEREYKRAKHIKELAKGVFESTCLALEQGGYGESTKTAQTIKFKACEKPKSEKLPIFDPTLSKIKGVTNLSQGCHKGVTDLNPLPDLNTAQGVTGVTGVTKENKKIVPAQFQEIETEATPSYTEQFRDDSLRCAIAEGTISPESAQIPGSENSPTEEEIGGEGLPVQEEQKQPEMPPVLPEPKYLDLIKEFGIIGLWCMVQGEDEPMLCNSVIDGRAKLTGKTPTKGKPKKINASVSVCSTILDDTEEGSRNRKALDAQHLTKHLKENPNPFYVETQDKHFKDKPKTQEYDLRMGDIVRLPDNHKHAHREALVLGVEFIGNAPQAYITLKNDTGYDPGYLRLNADNLIKIGSEPRETVIELIENFDFISTENAINLPPLTIRLALMSIAEAEEWNALW